MDYFILGVKKVMFTYVVCLGTLILSVLLTTFHPQRTHGVKPVAFSNTPPLAKRVVFISIDGLSSKVLHPKNEEAIEYLL